MNHTFKPLRKAPVYVKVFEAMEAEIVSGRLPEGSALPTEAELCAQFGVTRSSVREGIRLLEQADLVQRGSHKKLFVTRPQSHDVAAATSVRLARGGATFNEVWQALSMMYPGAVRLAVDVFSAADLEKLKTVHDCLSRADPGDHEAIVEGAVGFFYAIANGLKNRVLLALLQSLNMLIEASLRQVIVDTPAAKDRIMQAQAAIVHGLETHNADQAAEWMLRHIDDLKRGYAVAGLDADQSII